jgi:hypothetical protein
LIDESSTHILKAFIGGIVDPPAGVTGVAVEEAWLMMVVYRSGRLALSVVVLVGSTAANAGGVILVRGRAGHNPSRNGR